MLRSIFGEERRIDEGLLLQTNRAIEKFCSSLRKRYPCDKRVDSKWIRLELWASGLRLALNELEQSVYCADKFRVGLHDRYEEDLTDEERDDYYRHIYYYKNAFVRIFSTLDKTGYFVDTLFDAGTARIKERFSYFTVLRRLHQTGSHFKLEQRLFQIKLRYQAPLNRLRRKRNLEIHAINTELVDDVAHSRICYADKHMIEPLDDNMNDLIESYTMVCKSLYEIFSYSAVMLKR